jgi:urease accessory protein
MEAAATFAVSRTVSGQRTHWRDAPPVVLRPTGTDRLHLLHAAGGPLGGDRLRLTGTVGTACALRVQSAGATVVQPGPRGDPADWAVDLDVAAGASLRWAPQATVVCAGADFHGHVRATVDPDAFLLVRELLVLGRSGERGGRYRGGLAVTVGDTPLLAHENLVDGADGALSGPAGSGGHRVQGTVLLAGRGVRPTGERAGRTGAASWAVLPLDGPGCLVIAVGGLVTEVDAALDDALSLVDQQCSPSGSASAVASVRWSAG